MYYYYLSILILALVGNLEKIDFGSVNLIAITFACGVLFQQFQGMKKHIGELTNRIDNLPCAGCKEKHNCHGKPK